MRLRTLQWTLASVALLSLVAYQNCSEAVLKKKTTPSIQLSMSADFCAKAFDEAADNLKVYFVVDMSLSNMDLPIGGGGIEPGTDHDGDRLEAIKQFIDNCGTTRTRYAVTGFSDDLISEDSNMPCGTFENAGAAKGRVDHLIGVQDRDRSHLGEQFNFTMGGTRYAKSLQCVQTVITDDIAKDPVQARATNYLVFFVTDGKPEDNGNRFTPPTPGGPCVKDRLWIPTLETVSQLTFTSAQSFQFQPIFYGPSNTDAKCILDELAAAGGVDETIEIGNVEDADFCFLASTKVKSTYNLTSFGIINLTSLVENGAIVADSDMDGLSDGEEQGLTGFSSTNRRSNSKALDGLCRLVNDPSVCPPTPCDGSNLNFFGLSECDRKAFGVDGVDSDRDKLPDIVEILKGTRPDIKDALNNLDADGLNNISEILVGRNPRADDDDLPIDLQTIYQINSSQKCTGDETRALVNIDQIPLANTLAFSQTGETMPGGLSLSHAAGENVIFIYYQIERDHPLLELPLEVFGTYMKLPFGSTDSFNLTNTDFVKFGETAGSP